MLELQFNFLQVKRANMSVGMTRQAIKLIKYAFIKELIKTPNDIKPVVHKVTVNVIANPTNIFCTKLNIILSFENIEALLKCL